MFKKIIYFYNDIFEYLRFIDHLKKFESFVVDLEPHFLFKNHYVIKSPIEYTICKPSLNIQKQLYTHAIVVQINVMYINSFVNVFKYIHCILNYTECLAKHLTIIDINKDFLFEKEHVKILPKNLKNYRNGLETIME